MGEFDERLWENIGDLIFDPGRWAAAPGEVAAITRLLQLAPESRVLDMPCGTGRHSIALARAGYWPTGVELCGTYLDEARARSRAAGAVVEWVAADMLAFRRRSWFDAILNLNTSFGYFDRDCDNLLILKNMHDSLTVGGQILIDITTRDQLAKSLQPRKVREMAGTVFEELNQLTDGGRWLCKEVIVTRAGKRQSLKWGRHIYAVDELTDMLATASFAEIQLFEGLGGKAYGSGSNRLTLIARKVR